MRLDGVQSGGRDFFDKRDYLRNTFVIIEKIEVAEKISNVAIQKRIDSVVCTASMASGERR